MLDEDFFGLIGQTIDNTFAVQKQVGEGGFGVVYRALDTTLEVPVAIKCLKIPPHFTPEVRTAFYKKFHEEAKLLATLSEHPGIVRVYRFGQVQTNQGPVPYLALEWLKGHDLEHELANRKALGRPFSEIEAIQYMLPVIEAIGFAHRRNVAHRDLKPANIFVTESDGQLRLRVLDFGIAKVMQEGETATQLSTRTSSGFSAFSPQYGAPEQFYAKQYGATGPWTDVHALGLILVDLLTGRSGLGDDQTECTFLALDATRPTPKRFGVPISQELENVLLQALALAPKDRFANAGALHAAFASLANRPLTGAHPALTPIVTGPTIVQVPEPVAGYHTPLVRPTTAQPASLSTPKLATAEETAVIGRSGSRTWLWVSAAALAVLAIAIAGIVASQKSQQAPSLAASASIAMPTETSATPSASTASSSSAVKPLKGTLRVSSNVSAQCTLGDGTSVPLSQDISLDSGAYVVSCLFGGVEHKFDAVVKPNETTTLNAIFSGGTPLVGLQPQGPKGGKLPIATPATTAAPTAVTKPLVTGGHTKCDPSIEDCH